VAIEIIVALIGLAGVIVTTLTTLFYRLTTKNRQYKRELRFRADVLSLKIEFYDWNTIQEELRHLMNDTPIDRFMILNAFNGLDDPRWTTAIYQIIEGEHKVVSYVHVELDEDYVERLKRVKGGSNVEISVEDLPESLLKSVYKSENVKHALWFPIRERKLEDSESVGISYCTFASHTDEPISDEIKLHCKRISDSLRGAIYQAERRD